VVRSSAVQPMNLGTQLSAAGLLAAWGLSLFLWMSAVAVGRLILPRGALTGSTLDMIALAGPWGLVFLVSVPAVLISSGTTMMTLAPLLQIGAAAFCFFHRDPDPAIVPDEAVGHGGRLPSRKTIIIFFATTTLLAQGIYLFGIMPYRGGGKWQLPFEDYAWWAIQARQLAHNGIESWSAATALTFTARGTPVLHWYHWMDYWLTGEISRLL
jgi:hypothetical protein